MSTPSNLFDRAMARAHEGMEIAAVAAELPDQTAIYSAQGEQSFAELNARANQLVRAMRRAGVGEGDPVALLCSNRLEFAAVRFACHRMGARITPVNWHLSAEEISYIVGNCEAQVLFADKRVEASAMAAAASPCLTLRVAIGGDIEGFERFDEFGSDLNSDDIDDPILGNMMLYTSGTTGRPKGVLRKQADPETAAAMLQIMMAVFQYDPESGADRALCTGPLYHSGPFNICLTQPLSAGISTVLMDKWEPELTLQLIDEHKITHCFFVPTMFNRLLQLDETVRSRYDISTLKFVIHGAAPCSVDTKHAMLDWFGPVIWEIFAGTEGPGTMVSPQEWLERPGTVGKTSEGQVLILDEHMQALDTGQRGTVFLANPAGSEFEYYKDAGKTQSVIHDGYFTAGDIGYLDEQGYLFLTGRSAEVIIAGGVNIYPQEIDDVLAQHPAVADVACVGVPNEEWGEEVKAIVQLADGYAVDSALNKALLEFVETRLAKQKWPRSIDYVEDLPRSAAGKVQRKTLRQRYWEGRDI